MGATCGGAPWRRGGCAPHPRPPLSTPREHHADHHCLSPWVLRPELHTEWRGLRAGRSWDQNRGDSPHKSPRECERPRFCSQDDHPNSPSSVLSPLSARLCERRRLTRTGRRRVGCALGGSIPIILRSVARQKVLCSPARPIPKTHLHTPRRVCRRRRCHPFYLSLVRMVPPRRVRFPWRACARGAWPRARASAVRARSLSSSHL